MRRSRSGVHGSRARSGKPLDPRSAARSPGDPRAAEFHAPIATETIHLGELVEQIPEAVAILSTDDRVLSVSKDFTRMFGYGADEVVGRPLEHLIVPKTLIESAREYTDQLRRGERLQVETIRRRKDGTDVQVSLLAVPVTAGAGEHVANYAIYRDITERKRAEERLLESEARFRAIADTAPVMIWTTGTDGLCNYFSKPWLDFTGRTMEQEVGTGWIQGVHPDDLQVCFDSYWPAFHARETFRMEYRLRRADGEYRWVIESGVPRYTGAGEFAGYIGSNIDVTDLKRVEEERERLRRLQSELADRDRLATLGELTASLAHELNQPITGAIMSANACARWLRRDAPDVTKACDAAARIARDVMRAAGIIDRLRSLYMRGKPQRELIDVNEMIREMIVLLHDAAYRNSVLIRTDLDMQLPTTTADRVQLQQVLMNLMLNAIEAMKDTGGELTVTSQSTKDDQLLISVSDSGIGLPADGAGRIFEAFFTTKPQGTGMGLSLSRRIIESHGGHLWADANTGPGATFHFSLPRDTVEHEVTEPLHSS
jgi:PAS domain S-box-containing protein